MGNWCKRKLAIFTDRRYQNNKQTKEDCQNECIGWGKNGKECGGLSASSLSAHTQNVNGSCTRAKLYNSSQLDAADCTGIAIACVRTHTHRVSCLPTKTRWKLICSKDQVGISGSMHALNAAMLCWWRLFCSFHYLYPIVRECLAVCAWMSFASFGVCKIEMCFG